MAKCICGKRARDTVEVDICGECGDRVIACLEGIRNGKLEGAKTLDEAQLMKLEKRYEELLCVNEEQLRRITGLLSKNAMLEELLEKQQKAGQ